MWDDAVQLADKAKEAGVDVTLKVWDDLFHVFTLFPAPETDEALKYNGEFLAD